MNEKQEKLGAFPYVIGGVSFIPGIGIIFGIIAIIWGLVTKKIGGKKLSIIGACGIGFNVILYGSLFYFGFVQRGGVYDDLRTQLSKSTITSLVQAIEFYKTQNGNYPESLEVLSNSLPENSMVFVFDPTHMQMSGEQRYYHYELEGDSHYYLLGIGLDGKPYTSDDVLPEIEVKENSGIGFLIHEGSKNGLLQEVEVIVYNEEQRKKIQVVAPIEEKDNDQPSNNMVIVSPLTDGWQAYENKDYSQAIRLYSKHIQNKPEDKNGFYYRALAYEKINDDEKALEDFLQTVRLENDYFDAYLHIDSLLAKKSRYEEIVQYWSVYIEQVNTNGRAYLERGGAYIHAGEKVLALKDAKKACELGEKYGCQLLERYSGE